MNRWESLFIWLAIYCYVAGFGLFLTSLIFKKPLDRIGKYINIAGFILHTASFITRWAVAGHPPVQGNYENALMGSWFVLGIFIFGCLKYPNIIHTAIIVNPFNVLILGVGLNTVTKIEPLDAPYQSNWLWVHVAFAWFAFGAFAIAFCLGMAYLLRQFKPDFLSALPDLKRIDDLILGFILFGFISQAFMIASGSIWAAKLWNAYWSWDPIETWSLISWLYMSA